MKTEPNAYDAAFAAAMLGARMENATLNTMTRVSLAAMAIAELEAEDAIPEGDYECWTESGSASVNPTGQRRESGSGWPSGTC
jgi:hypothetical protein